MGKGREEEPEKENILIQTVRTDTDGKVFLFCHISLLRPTSTSFLSFSRNIFLFSPSMWIFCPSLMKSLSL